MVVQSSSTTSRLLARASRAWMSRATSSFPVPVSPVTSTGASVKAATSTTCRSSDRHAGLWPTRLLATRGESTRRSTAAQRPKRATTSAAVSPPGRVRGSTSLAPSRTRRHAAPSISARGSAATASTRSAPLPLASRTKAHSSSVTSSNTTIPGPRGPSPFSGYGLSPAPASPRASGSAEKVSTAPKPWNHRGALGKGRADPGREWAGNGAPGTGHAAAGGRAVAANPVPDNK